MMPESLMNSSDRFAGHIQHAIQIFRGRYRGDATGIGRLATIAIITLAGIAVGYAPPVRAVPITYTVQGMAEGILDTTGFTSTFTQITFTEAGDTSNITNSGLKIQNQGTVTFTIAGVGSGTLTSPGAMFVENALQAGGVADVNSVLILGTVNSAFGGYSLATAFGPISGTALDNSGISFPTSAGRLTIISVSGQSVFTATTGTVTSAPEPAVIILLLTALAGFAFTRWRRSA